MRRLLAPAKVNLFLAIQGKDASGYHLLDTVFVKTRLLQDEIFLEPAHAFKLECSDPSIQENSILKAIRILEEHCGRIFSYAIRLVKNIPLGSGLGGASSDAAAILAALNSMENLGLSSQELMQLGAQVGMDVPFFLSGFSAAHGTHYGEVLEPLPPLPLHIQMRLALGSSPSETAQAFARWDEQPHPEASPSSALLREALIEGNARKILENLHNDFQIFFAPPVLAQGEVAVLTGSGSAHVVLKASAVLASHESK